MAATLREKVFRLHAEISSAVADPNRILIIDSLAAFGIWMTRKEIDKPGFPPVGEFMEMIVDSGAHFYGCKMSMDMMKLTKEDLIDDAEVSGAMEFMELSEGTNSLCLIDKWQQKIRCRLFEQRQFCYNYSHERLSFHFGRK